MLSQKLARGLQKISKGSTDLTLITQGQTGELDKEKWCDAYFIHEIQWVFKRYFNRYLNVLDILKLPHLYVYMFACACPHVPLCFCYLVHLKECLIYISLLLCQTNWPFVFFIFGFIASVIYYMKDLVSFYSCLTFQAFSQDFSLKCISILVVYVIKTYIVSGPFL